VTGTNAIPEADQGLSRVQPLSRYPMLRWWRGWAR
jgi:hypothetical protein